MDIGNLCDRESVKRKRKILQWHIDVYDARTPPSSEEAGQGRKDTQAKDTRGGYRVICAQVGSC